MRFTAALRTRLGPWLALDAKQNLGSAVGFYIGVQRAREGNKSRPKRGRLLGSRGCPARTRLGEEGGAADMRGPRVSQQGRGKGRGQLWAAVDGPVWGSKQAREGLGRGGERGVRLGVFFSFFFFSAFFSKPFSK